MDQTFCGSRKLSAEKPGDESRRAFFVSFLKKRHFHASKFVLYLVCLLTITTLFCPKKDRNMPNKKDKSRREVQSEILAEELGIDIPKGTTLTARSIAALHTLRSGSVVRLQFDDSEGDFNTRQQLQRIADNCGFDFIFTKPDRVAYLIGEDCVTEIA